SREPLSPWPDMHGALELLLRRALSSGVSFAARGNLLLLAPPLVIGEQDLADGLDLLDRLIGELGAALSAARYDPTKAGTLA
ncbi:MAG TPA: hypothetical protein VJ011_07095, partial [Steroidobacteraceae bacterium]|nr:hypothetical protein [Steroidobacteraceae bacterium]